MQQDLSFGGDCVLYMATPEPVSFVQAAAPEPVSPIRKTPDEPVLIECVPQAAASQFLRNRFGLKVNNYRCSDKKILTEVQNNIEILSQDCQPMS